MGPRVPIDRAFPVQDLGQGDARGLDAVQAKVTHPLGSSKAERTTPGDIWQIAQGIISLNPGARASIQLT